MAQFIFALLDKSIYLRKNLQKNTDKNILQYFVRAETDWARYTDRY